MGSNGFVNRRSGFQSPPPAQTGKLNKRAPVAVKLQALADRSGGPDACWPWTGRRDPDGYGRLGVGQTNRGAHVLAYEIANGAAVSPGQVVRHRCDNPPCVNPAHLLVGTYQDNSDDMLTRGRTLRGERCPSAKITDADADEIRRLAGSCPPYGLYSQLARRYGISSRAVSFIAKGQRRAHAEVRQ